MEKTAFKVGDTIRVSTRDPQEQKVHSTTFEGIVISKKGEGQNVTFTVQKNATGQIKVERIFAQNSPTIEQIKVLKSQKVRRAKLYYLRKR